MSETLKEALRKNDPLVEVGHGHEQESHGPSIYAKTLGALLVLTVVTVLASRIQFGSGMVNVIVALGIATLKASLVALFFMHLRYDRPLDGIIFVSSLVFLGIFLITCYTDQQTRDPLEPNNLKVVVPAPGGAAPPMSPPGAPTTGTGATNQPASPAPAPAHH